MVHTHLKATKYLNTNHGFDRLLHRDHLADRESHSVAHTLPVTIACHGPHQHMARHTLFRSGTHVVVHINMLTIKYLIASFMAIALLIAVALLIDCSPA